MSLRIEFMVSEQANPNAERPAPGLVAPATMQTRSQQGATAECVCWVCQSTQQGPEQAR